MNVRPFAVSVPADPKYLKVIRGFFQPVIEGLFGEKEAGMLLLALDEACSNVIKHRSKAHMEGLIHVRGEVRESSLLFRIGDFCGADDIPNIKPRELQDVRPGGLGTHFIAEIMDRVAFEPETDSPGRLALVLEKAVPTGQKPHEHQDRSS